MRVSFAHIVFDATTELINEAIEEKRMRSCMLYDSCYRASSGLDVLAILMRRGVKGAEVAGGRRQAGEPSVSRGDLVLCVYSVMFIQEQMSGRSAITMSAGMVLNPAPRSSSYLPIAGDE
jgi:hypothetical protein